MSRRFVRLLAALPFLHGTRILFAIGRDGMLPEFFRTVNPRTRTPVRNTVLVAVPVTPILSILGCLWIIIGLRWITIEVFAIWVSVVLVWYFTYGIRHSHLNDLHKKVQDAAGGS